MRGWTCPSRPCARRSAAASRIARVSLGDSVHCRRDRADARRIDRPDLVRLRGRRELLPQNIRQDAARRARLVALRRQSVDIQLADETDYRWHGRMVFLDNAVDPNSGTIRAHAVVPNPTRFLTPGMFGRARLLGSGTYARMLIPDEAIVTDQTRRLVYVVGQDGKAVSRTWKPGAKVEGLRIVRDGLAPTDLVVLDGIGRLQPGAPVEAASARSSSRAPTISRAPDRRRWSSPSSGHGDSAIRAAHEASRISSSIGRSSRRCCRS